MYVSHDEIGWRREEGGEESGGWEGHGEERDGRGREGKSLTPLRLASQRGIPTAQRRMGDNEEGSSDSCKDEYTDLDVWSRTKRVVRRECERHCSLSQVITVISETRP